MFQVCQLCISLHIIHSSQIEKCIVIGLDIPGTHTTRSLCQRAYSLSKTPSRFYEKIEILYYSYMDKFSFLHRNSRLVILTKYPKSCIDHLKSLEASISCKSFERELMVLCQIHKINVAYTFLRGS